MKATFLILALLVVMLNLPNTFALSTGNSIDSSASSDPPPALDLARRPGTEKKKSATCEELGVDDFSGSTGYESMICGGHTASIYIKAASKKCPLMDDLLCMCWYMTIARLCLLEECAQGDAAEEILTEYRDYFCSEEYYGTHWSQRHIRNQATIEVNVPDWPSEEEAEITVPRDRLDN